MRQLQEVKRTLHKHIVVPMYFLQPTYLISSPWWFNEHKFLSLSHTGPKILLYNFLSKIFNCFLSLSVSVPVSDAYVNVLSVVVFFSHNFSFFDMFLFLKIFCSIKYVLLAFFILSQKSIWLLLSSLSIIRNV